MGQYTLAIMTATLAGVAAAQQLQWQLVATAGPAPRQFPQLTFQPTNGTTILFGGLTSTGGGHGDTWLWNGSQWANIPVSGPPGRGGGCFVYDKARSISVLFGGSVRTGSGVAVFGDTWEWDGIRWTLRHSSGPSARSEPAMVFDEARSKLVLFGGTTTSTQFDDTWEYDGGQWTQVPVASPGANSSHAMAYDRRRGVTVLFGGYRPSAGILGETWEYNGRAWVRRFAPSPPARYYHDMYYDERMGASVIHGGSGTSGMLGDTWAWDGQSWTQIAAPLNPRHVHRMTYDSVRGVGVMFGGQGVQGTTLAETWELPSPCMIVTQPADQSVGVDMPVTFLVEVAASTTCSTSIAYQWQRRNPAVVDESSANAWVNLEEGGGFLNTRSPVMAIIRPTPALATGYRCKISGGCGCGYNADGIVYTNTVNFSVACPADFNADGGIDFGDVEAFFERWENGC